MAKTEQPRSYCPVNLITEVIGDKWSLLILRDIIFYKRRHFNELLRQSEEGIASNILRDRLVMFERNGLIFKTRNPYDEHKQKITYTLTEKSIDLLPVIVEAIGWSLRHEPVDRSRYRFVVDINTGGQLALKAFRSLLRQEHLNR